MVSHSILEEDQVWQLHKEGTTCLTLISEKSTPVSVSYKSSLLQHKLRPPIDTVTKNSNSLIKSGIKMILDLSMLRDLPGTLMYTSVAVSVFGHAQPLAKCIAFKRDKLIGRGLVYRRAAYHQAKMGSFG